jgi:hypothetical protein
MMPGVKAAVRDQVLSDVQTRGLLNRPEELDAYLGRYRTIFGRFPQLRDELGNAAALRRQFDTAQMNEDNIMRQLGPQGRGAVAKYLQYGDEMATRTPNGR